MSGFEFEGYTCLYRSRDILDSIEEFLLKEGKVPGLVPVFIYKENLEWFFVYDLEGGYTLGEIYGRGEKLIGVNWFVSFLEGFFISKDSVLLDFDDLYKVRFVYCPLYKGYFLGFGVVFVRFFLQGRRVVF